MLFLKLQPYLALALGFLGSGAARPDTQSFLESHSCRKTQVAVLGAGMAGITAAQTLAEAGVTDFVIVEYRDRVGGRVTNTEFGKNPKTGEPFQVELGANWLEVSTSPPRGVNPIIALARKYELRTTHSDYGSLITYDQNGPNDFTELVYEFGSIGDAVLGAANRIKEQGLLDLSVRAGYRDAGWNPGTDPKAQAIEWWFSDSDSASRPDGSSLFFNTANGNWTNESSDYGDFVVDSRGYSVIIRGEASTFLNCTEDYDCSDDDRLLLNTVVTKISYSGSGVTITNHDGSCIQADYAVCTFSLGILQQSLLDEHSTSKDRRIRPNPLKFSPSFPQWKKDAIQSFPMGTYTKIFMQFPPDQIFWDTKKQFFLYADPYRRGYYPLYQNLDHEGMYPGSCLLIVTIVGNESLVVEAQPEEVTKQQILTVIRSMFGEDNVPEPTAFMFPRWTREPWAYGSWKTWPNGVTLQQNANLKANLGRLYFAGEATSAQYWGYLHGAWYEGDEVGRTVANCIKHNEDCEDYARYEVIEGPTEANQFNPENGWFEE